MQKSTVGSKGEIFPPKEIRERLGLKPGVEINYTVEDSRLIIERIPKVRELLKEEPQIKITLGEFRKFRRDLSKQAESR